MGKDGTSDCISGGVISDGATESNAEIKSYDGDDAESGDLDREKEQRMLIDEDNKSSAWD